MKLIKLEILEPEKNKRSLSTHLNITIKTITLQNKWNEKNGLRKIDKPRVKNNKE